MRIANSNGGILTIGNSTVSGNHVSLSGCSHSCSATGGGIYNRGTLVLYNSTISGNTASPYGQANGSGIYTASLGTAIIQNSTLGGNGGAGAATIYGPAALQNSIVAEYQEFQIARFHEMYVGIAQPLQTFMRLRLPLQLAQTLRASCR